MDILFNIAMKYIGLDFEESKIRDLYEKSIRNFEKHSLSGEFDHLGGSKGATLHNIKIYLDWWATPEVKQLWHNTIPELA